MRFNDKWMSNILYEVLVFIRYDYVCIFFFTWKKFIIFLLLLNIIEKVGIKVLGQDFRIGLLYYCFV